MIWNASYTGRDDLGANLGLFVLSRDLVNDVVQANNCSARYATYDISVTVQELSSVSTTAQLRNMALGSAMPNNGLFIAQYTLSALSALDGTVWAGPDGVLVVEPHMDGKHDAHSVVFHAKHIFEHALR